jgi:hypothetical protein
MKLTNYGLSPMMSKLTKLAILAILSLPGCFKESRWQAKAQSSEHITVPPIDDYPGSTPQETPCPEPMTLSILAAGGVGLYVARRKRNKNVKP